MSAEPSESVTVVLAELRAGDPKALDTLMPLVYGELQRIAHWQLTNEATGHTMSTTALVHEAYLKLVDQARVGWEDRAHFFAVAARAMRHILVDYARRHKAARRGGPIGQPLSLDNPAAMSLSTAERAE
ncbi:MAG: RNA polymerase subunit sigma-70, partial [Phycisphaerae bacterium]|nr:RNA polymerase subunit sigma-70 [Gemmatimonadaceae bacterium]